MYFVPFLQHAFGAVLLHSAAVAGEILTSVQRIKTKFNVENGLHAAANRIERRWWHTEQTTANFKLLAPAALIPSATPNVCRHQQKERRSVGRNHTTCVTLSREQEIFFLLGLDEGLIIHWWVCGIWKSD